MSIEKFYEAIGGKDKLEHFGVCSIIAGCTTLMLVFFAMPLEYACLTGIGFALVAGIGKEFLDKMMGREFSVKDLLADGIGAVMGSGIASGILLLGLVS